MSSTITIRPPGDNPALSTRGRVKAHRETSDVAEATGRLVMAVGRRVADEDPEDLAHIVHLVDKAAEALALAVHGLRQTGYSDAQIGGALGITKQAVAQRWPRSAVTPARCGHDPAEPCLRARERK